MAGNVRDHKSWFTTQRQNLGPDWTTRIHPDNLNRDIERLIRDMYYGNIGETSVVTNPDFKDLCSYTIVSALYGYYGNKINVILPLYNMFQQYKAQNLAMLESIAPEYRSDAEQKLYNEFNSTPVFHFIDEVYEYYYKAYALLDGYINQSHCSDYSYMARLCQLVNKGKWANPNSRFI